MSLATVHSRALVGLQAPLVTVEVHLANGLPSFTLVGLADTEVREARERVRAALHNSGLEFPMNKRITVSLAPADLPKESGRFDLPIALGILAASGQVDPRRLEGHAFAGELSLGGGLRPVRGALAMALSLHGASAASTADPTALPTEVLVLPPGSAEEAALVDGLTVLRADHLMDVVNALRPEPPRGTGGKDNRSPDPAGAAAAVPTDGEAPRATPALNTEGGRANSAATGGGLAAVLPRARPWPAQAPAALPDLRDVRGQAGAKRALEIAAAGSHSLLMVGPPGTGKSMLAQRLAGLLPPMTQREALESAALLSLAGLFTPDRWRQRSLRSPHHSASSAALVGGGAPPRPGEISLAHAGVLFLDELPEYPRAALEALREPLERGRIVISRAMQQAEFPCHVSLVAAMNPCPCGHHGSSQRACRCSPDQVARYQGRISGPLLDRIDLQVEVPALPVSALGGQASGETSAVVAARVAVARQRQLDRQGVPNAALAGDAIDAHCALSAGAAHMLQQAAVRLNWSARSHHRALRVARSVADLAGSATLETVHLAEAIQYRRALLTG